MLIEMTDIKKNKKIEIEDYISHGEVAEWSIAAVLKTVIPKGIGGSNPPLSSSHFSLFEAKILGMLIEMTGFAPLLNDF